MIIITTICWKVDYDSIKLRGNLSHVPDVDGIVRHKLIRARALAFRKTNG